jgi:hypothetical protein
MTARPVPARLFHYTCTHAIDAIDDDGLLRPITDVHPLTLDDGVLPLLWLTDLSVPIRDALGLTSTILRCDRTEIRYDVTSTDDVLAWTDWRRAHRHDARILRIASVLESESGARPAHWFVSEIPLRSSGVSVRVSRPARPGPSDVRSMTPSGL